MKVKEKIKSHPVVVDYFEELPTISLLKNQILNA